ncbi:hypothetical protein Tco_0877768 [Tanacetum coccineum]|uniref:Uncharacterized protein n=1 Tax=Tanacetum coccineum TaxID=301880 RepID=A0ABQ5BZ45_9ASTR
MMSTNDKESSVVGTDNHPPMLEEIDFDSWKIRIERYIRGKPQGKLIWKSVTNRPSPHPMITVTTGEDPSSLEEYQISQQLTFILGQSYEQHAMKTLSKMNQTSGNTDPLAYMAKATQSSSSLLQYVPLPSQHAPAPQQAPQKGDKALLIEAKEKGVVLDAEAEAFLADVECTIPYAEPLAITTTTTFEVSQEDAYDSDVDEAPLAAAAFMSNLIQTGPSTREGINKESTFSKVHTYDNHFYDDLNDQVSQEMYQEEQIDSDVDLDIDDDDNTIPYHQYQLDNEVKNVPTDVSSAIPDEISMITILDDLRLQLASHIKANEEQSLANDSLKAELERYKTQVQNLEQSKVKRDLEQLVFERNKQKILFTPLWVHDNKETLVQAEVSRTKMCKVSPKPNECLLTESVSKDICSIVLTSDIVVPMGVESKNLELKAEILKYKACFENPQVCNNSSSPELNVIFEINNLREQLQGKDESIKKFKAQINNMKEVSENPNLSNLEFQALETKNTQLKEELTAVRIKNDSLKNENFSIKKRYQDLSKSKASNSNVSSRTVVPEKPKVLTPGLYAMSLKIKSVLEASKSKSKSEKKTNRNFPARSENVKKVENPLRNLNKKNRVDSSLNDRRTEFYECSKTQGHNNANVKHVLKATGKVFASVSSRWKPTRRKFSLGDTCPLTRNTKPEVVPLEKSGSVSTSEPDNNVTVIPRFSEKPLTSYKRKDRKTKDTSTGSPPNAKTQAANYPVIVYPLPF